MADRLSKEHRSWNMSRIRGKNTRPELQLRSLMHRSGFRFRLHDAKLPGKPDIVLPKHNTVIFVNGCYWHRHEGCPKATTPKTRTDFWQEKFRRTIERDKHKRVELMQAGWSVITVWECELADDPTGVVKGVKSQITQDISDKILR